MPVRDSLDDVVAGLSPPGAGGTAGQSPRPASAEAVGTVFSKWDDIVGAAVARHVRPVRIEGATLLVAVDQPAWATQVRALAPRVLARVGERTGEPLERLEVVVRPPR